MTAWQRSKNKFGNKITRLPCHYGFSHRSKLEAAVCDQIYLKEIGGELRHLKHEDTIRFDCLECGEKRAYIPDFKVQDVKSEEIYWIEAKGFADKRWARNKRLWKRFGPGRLEIYGGTWRGLTLDLVIIPTGREDL